MEHEWLLCWRFRKDKESYNKAAVVADIISMDKKPAWLSPVPATLKKYKELFRPKVFETYEQADTYARQVFGAIGFKTFSLK